MLTNSKMTSVRLNAGALLDLLAELLVGLPALMLAPNRGPYKAGIANCN